MNILMSVNRKFLEPLENMIFSILYYSEENVNIYLMYQETELKQDDLKQINDFVAETGKGIIYPIKFDTTELSEMPVTDNAGAFFGMEAYSRLYCAFKLPEKVKKILYLDADMICTGSIMELYNTTFEGKTWIAVRDEGIKAKDLERLKLKSDYKYINSGMLLINIEKLRKIHTEKTITDLIKKNKEVLIYPDQDFINKIFVGDIKIVDKKYNLLAKDIRYKELKEKPLIIHYAGSTKPWNEDVSRFEKEYIEPYYEVLKLQKGKEEQLKYLLKKHEEHGYRK